MPAFRFLNLVLTIAALLVLCTPAIAKKCDNPPCGGGGGDGGSGGEVMTLRVGVDWLGQETSTGDFETVVECAQQGCSFSHFFDGDLPALTLPPEFVQHWEVDDAEACFGGINPDGSATVAMQGVSMTTHFEYEDGLSFFYTGWTTAGSSEPVLYRTHLKHFCVEPDCPLLPPDADGGVLTFENAGIWFNTVQDANKKGRNKRSDPCYCVQGCDGGIPAVDSVTVTRP